MTEQQVVWFADRVGQLVGAGRMQEACDELRAISRMWSPEEAYEVARRVSY